MEALISCSKAPEWLVMRLPFCLTHGDVIEADVTRSAGPWVGGQVAVELGRLLLKGASILCNHAVSPLCAGPQATSLCRTSQSHWQVGPE